MSTSVRANRAAARRSQSVVEPAKQREEAIPVVEEDPTEATNDSVVITPSPPQSNVPTTPTRVQEALGAYVLATSNANDLSGAVVVQGAESTTSEHAAQAPGTLVSAPTHEVEDSPPPKPTPAPKSGAGGTTRKRNRWSKAALLMLAETGALLESKRVTGRRNHNDVEFQKQVLADFKRRVQKLEHTANLVDLDPGFLENLTYTKVVEKWDSLKKLFDPVRENVIRIDEEESTTGSNIEETEEEIYRRAITEARLRDPNAVKAPEHFKEEVDLLLLAKLVVEAQITRIFKSVTNVNSMDPVSAEQLEQAVKRATLDAASRKKIQLAEMQSRKAEHVRNHSAGTAVTDAGNVGTEPRPDQRQPIMSPSASSSRKNTQSQMLGLMRDMSSALDRKVVEAGRVAAEKMTVRQTQFDKWMVFQIARDAREAKKEELENERLELELEERRVQLAERKLRLAVAQENVKVSPRKRARDSNSDDDESDRPRKQRAGRR